MQPWSNCYSEGAIHKEQQLDPLAIFVAAGEFILRTRPACVVLETAMSAQFGTATGNLLTAQDADAQRSDQVMLRMLFAMSDALSRHADPLVSDEWKQIKGQIPCEQLGAVAGLAVGAALMYGDRPKATTYRRLMHCCTTEELDASFGRRSARNMRDLLSALGVSTSDVSDIAEVASGATGTADSVERVLLTEREAVLCHSAHAAAAQCKDKSDSVVVLTGEHVSDASELIRRCSVPAQLMCTLAGAFSTLVFTHMCFAWLMCAGESHLDTMQRMLKTSSWQGLAGHGDRAAADTTTTTTSSSSSGGSEAWRKSAWGEPPADAQIEGRWGAGERHHAFLACAKSLFLQYVCQCSGVDCKAEHARYRECSENLRSRHYSTCQPLVMS